MRHRASPQAPSTWKGRPGTLRGAAEATRETEEHAVDMDRLDERREEQRKEPVRGASEEHRDADSQAAHVQWEDLRQPNPHGDVEEGLHPKDCIRRPRLTVG
jgi:hypothetical protein